MPLTRECLRHFTVEELKAIRGNEPFISQDKLILQTLQHHNNLDVPTFDEIHRKEGCKVTSVYFYSQPSGMYETVDFTEVNIHLFGDYCRNHGVVSDVWSDFSIPDVLSTLPFEQARFAFIKHITETKPNNVSSYMSAWRKYQRVSKEAQIAMVRTNIDLKERTLWSTPEDVQLCIDYLTGTPMNTKVIADTVGRFTFLVFGSDERYGELIAHLDKENQTKALTFCKNMLPFDWSEEAANQLEQATQNFHI